MCLSPISHQLEDEYRQREDNANSPWPAPVAIAGTSPARVPRWGGRPLLAEALFLVELLCPGMQRNAQALYRRFEPDGAALGVSGVEHLARARVPQGRR